MSVCHESKRFARVSYCFRIIGDRTESIQRKNCAFSQIAASNGRAKRFTGWECRRPSFSGKKDSQCAIKIGAHHILRNNTETKAYFFCLS